MDFIQDLAARASVHTFNSLRSTPADRAHYMQTEFAELKSYARRGLYKFLLARDNESGERIGYLLLNLFHLDDLGRRQTFVEDLAALPEYWGRGIGHALFDEATRVTAELGIDFMAGEVSALNPRWEAALRNNFFLEAYKVVRPCTEAAREQLKHVEQVRSEHQQLQQQIQARRQKRLERKKRRAERQ